MKKFNYPIGKTVNSNLPMLKIIAEQWGLKINNLKHFNIATRILKNSIKNN